MPMRRRTLLLSALPPALARTAGAQPLPRHVRYVVPVPAGGGGDTVARIVAEAWAKALGATVVIENLGGNSGAAACQKVAEAAPDGATLLQAYSATHATGPAVRPKLPYDAVRDFTPVAMIGMSPNVLVVNATLPAADLPAFVAYLRRNPGNVLYGSGGNGTLTHLTMELFKVQAKAYAVHLPYAGLPQAFGDLTAGKVQAMFPSLVAALPHIRAGRVRALAVTGRTRHPLLKEVPTLIESGFEGFDAMQWYGVVGPAALPAPLAKSLNDSLNGVLAGADTRRRLAAEAIETQPMKPDAFGAYIKSDIARWMRLARERRIVVDG